MTRADVKGRTALHFAATRGDTNMGVSLNVHGCVDNENYLALCLLEKFMQNSL